MPGSVDVALWLAVAGVAGLALLRLLQWEFSRYTVVALALTPFVLLGAVLLTGLAALLRLYWAGGVAALCAVLLTFVVLPRLLPDEQPVADGRPLVVASANLYFGEGASGGVVDLVRYRHVDVLSLQELTPDAVRALDDAGLAELLPYRLFRDDDGARGSGLASRFPLQRSPMSAPSRHEQPGVLIDVPGAGRVEIFAVHPVQPLIEDEFPRWRQELAALPAPRGDDTIRLLVGDFNATLDHPELSRLLAAGYADAADRVGAGLRPTWPSQRPWPPLVTIDHVLVDPRCVVRTFDVVPIQGSDHRAILAEVVLPAPPA